MCLNFLYSICLPSFFASVISNRPPRLIRFRRCECYFSVFSLSYFLTYCSLFFLLGHLHNFSLISIRACFNQEYGANVQQKEFKHLLICHWGIKICALWGGKPPFIDRHMEATDPVTVNIRGRNNRIAFVRPVSRQTNLFFHTHNYNT